MLPTLYSFRRCPYAIRARMAIKHCGIAVELREVVLSDKPAEMLATSPKGTVPVLILPDGTVIDESYDIMCWSLAINDPDNWLPDNEILRQKMDDLIETNDGPFKEYLDKYKYAARFPEYSAEDYRQQAEGQLQILENLLGESSFLLGDHMTMADIAIFPFIRQFAFVDKNWFDQTQYKQLQKWLKKILNMDKFTDVMNKYPQWVSGSEGVEF
jgi:glutathione S-transferase